MGAVEPPPALLPGKRVGSPPTAHLSARKTPAPPASSCVLVAERQPSTRAIPHPSGRQSLWRGQGPVGGGAGAGNTPPTRGGPYRLFLPELGVHPLGCSVQHAACHKKTHPCQSGSWIPKRFDFVLSALLRAVNLTVNRVVKMSWILSAFFSDR